MTTIISLMILMVALYSYQTFVRDGQDEPDRNGNYAKRRRR